MNKQYNKLRDKWNLCIKDGALPSFFSLSANVMDVKFTAILVQIRN